MQSAAGKIKGQLFNIQRFSLDDGPGIRSTVFLKGCNQRCAWCHNPESLRVTPQLMRKHSICTACGACIEVCPRGANHFSAEFLADPGKADRKVLTADSCIGCGTCVPVCPARALKVMGYTLTAEETMEVLVKDRRYYERSGGGITFSGGEPTCQSEYLLAMLDACNEEGLHRAIETNGNTSPELVREFSQRLDYVMIDLKHVDDEKHRAFTGAGNKRTLESIRYYTAHNETEVRIPVIPAFNDTPREMQAMLDFLADCEVPAVTLLPYHTFGISKYESLSMDYPLEEREAAAAEDVQLLLDKVDKRGIACRIK